MTAYTSPPCVVMNIDSVVCTCCGTRWWPEGGAPSFPESYVCEVCEQWFALFQIPGELPVFWACGVTPQAAVMASGVPFAVTHAPGYMFITDMPDSSYHV